MPRNLMNSSALSIPALAGCFARAGVNVPEDALPGVVRYLELLLRWNRIMNLTGAASWQEAATGLVADSFRLAPFLENLPLPQSPQTWDLGAGAGLPGIPLRLVWQRGQYTLVEKRAKRAMFLSQVSGMLELPRTRVYAGSAEAFFAEAQPADCILSRAFMPWGKMLPFVAPVLKPGGVVLFMAGCALDEGRLPDGWSVLSQTSYPSNREMHWLWAVQKSGCGDCQA